MKHSGFFVFSLLAALIFSTDAAVSGRFQLNPFTALLAAKGKATLLAGKGIGGGATLAGAGAAISSGSGGRGSTTIINNVVNSNTRFRG